jgi:hypothetical protein
MIAAPVLDNHRAARAGVAIAGAILILFQLATKRDGRASAFAVARVMAANDGSGCPYVFAGDSILYHLAHACLPTAYAFPSTLAYDSERGASGIDEAVEVRRIMRRRRPLVVTLDRPLAPWNAKSEAIVRDALGPTGWSSLRRGKAATSSSIFAEAGSWPNETDVICADCPKRQRLDHIRRHYPNPSMRLVCFPMLVPAVVFAAGPLGAEQIGGRRDLQIGPRSSHPSQRRA